MKYGKLDESKFSLYSKILCATLDRVRIEFLCENAKKAIKEYAEEDQRNIEDINFESQLELWKIYNFLGDHPDTIEDKSVEIISYFLKQPVIDCVIKGDVYWLLEWEDYDLLIWDQHWQQIYNENIENLIDDNLDEFRELWMRQESGEDIWCERNYDLFKLACELGFKIERLWDNSDHILIRIPKTGVKYDSYFSEIGYQGLQYAR